jgi:hypothetical protein
MHGEFLHLLFLQAHRETEAHFTATGLPSQRNHSDSFRFKRAASYQSLKSKVGLAAVKACPPPSSPLFPSPHASSKLFASVIGTAVNTHTLAKTKSPAPLSIPALP